MSSAVFSSDVPQSHLRPIQCAAPLTRQTIPDLESRLGEVLARPGRPSDGRLVLDLTHAEYVDSDGVRWLQSLRDRLRAERAELRLRLASTGPIVRTFDLLQLRNSFDIELLDEGGPRTHAA